MRGQKKVKNRVETSGKTLSSFFSSLLSLSTRKKNGHASKAAQSRAADVPPAGTGQGAGEREREQQRARMARRRRSKQIALNLAADVFSSPLSTSTRLFFNLDLPPRNEKKTDPTNRRPHHRRLLGHLPPWHARTLSLFQGTGLRLRLRQEVYRSHSVRHRAIPGEGARGRGQRGRGRRWGLLEFDSWEREREDDEREGAKRERQRERDRTKNTSTFVKSKNKHSPLPFPSFF